MDTTISTARPLHGTVKVPGDKSISHRALMISSIARGNSEIHGLLDAADPRSTLQCLRDLGVDIRLEGPIIRVKGGGLHGLRPASGTLDAGNSGTTIRLLSGILAGQPFASTITGDDSLRQRPMKRIIEPLSLMGADIQASDKLTAPLSIRGTFPLRSIEYRMPISSAQVKSAVLFAGLFADGTTRIIEATKTRDHTERMMGLPSHVTPEGHIVEVNGGRQPEGQQMQVPGDISSAAFLIAAGLLVPHSELTIANVGLNPSRTRVLDIFRSIGGSVEVVRQSTIAGEMLGDLLVKSSRLEGAVELDGRDVAELIDEIPILAVTLAVGGCALRVRGASDLRNKESDRIYSVVENLRRLRLDVEEYPDGFAFQAKNPLIPAKCDSFDDHRIAMSFGVAGLVLKGETVITRSECVDISFPSFWNLLQGIQRQ